MGKVKIKENYFLPKQVINLKKALPSILESKTFHRGWKSY